MNLNEFIFYKELTQKQIAEMLDIQPSYIRRILGGLKPSRKVTRKLEIISNGLVTAETIISPPTHPDYQKIKMT